MLRVAVLDDHQHAATRHADWFALPEPVEVVAFHDHVDGDALVARLQGFPVVVAARERGVTVCGTGFHAPATAELTWALILAVARHVPQEDAAVRAGGWQHTAGVDLDGAVLGVVGLGSFGKRAARIGRAFGMDVIACQEPLPPDHPLRELRRVVRTPHLGYVTEKTYAVFYRDVVDDVAAFLAGRPVRVVEP